ncbi:MAG: cbb3-type cytochrome c oxidase subunit I [Thermoprotei archaeon]
MPHTLWFALSATSLLIATLFMVVFNRLGAVSRLTYSELLFVWAGFLLVYFIVEKPYMGNTPKSVGSWVKRWLTTTNHKDIGLLYIATSLFFALVGGVLAELMRTQLMAPNNKFLTPLAYNQAVTIHGLVMVLWFLSPLAFGFANYIVPLQIRAKDLAFPRLNALSYWLYLASGIAAALAFFLPGGNLNGGWTFYAPLSSGEYMPGPGPTLGLMGALMLIASVTISTVNFLVTIVWLRAPEVTWAKLPMFTWFILITVIQMLLAFPALFGAMLMLVVDRVAGTLYFTSTSGGAALLWDNMFWFFGHPEVYIVLLPALGVLAEVIPVFSATKLYGRRSVLIAVFALALPLGMLVWGHHMYMTTIPNTEKEVFELGTDAISIPFIVTIFALIRTLGGGRVRLSTPMLFALGALSVFILGGITGLFLAAPVLDAAYRGSYFVVAHFHYIMAGTTMFGLFSALYYWFPRITGRMYNEALGKIHFTLTFIALNITYFPMFLVGEMPRRIFTYNVESWGPPNFAATIGAYALGLVQILLVYNLLKSAVSGPRAPTDPWGAGTPEWVEEEETATVVLGVGSGPLRSATATPQDAERGVTQIGRSPPSLVVLEHVSVRPVTLSVGILLSLLGLALLNYDALGLPFVALGVATVTYALLGWVVDPLTSDESIVGAWPFNRVSKTKLGVWTFLFSEIILFGGILTADAYVRMNDPTAWPTPGSLHPIMLGAISTFILLSSSPAAYMALSSIERGSVRGMVGWLGVTLTLGAIFDSIEFYEWAQLLSRGLTPWKSNALSTYYFTVGVHATHVLIGLIIMGYLIARGLSGGITQQKHEALEAFGIFWSFVDAIWVFIFAFFFLI